MWDLWWTKWHWDRFLPEYFGYLLSISFHRCSITRKSREKTNNFHHRVAQEALRLRCVRSICCGALYEKEKYLQAAPSLLKSKQFFTWKRNLHPWNHNVQKCMPLERR
jgi:hypothetical protein